MGGRGLRNQRSPDEDLAASAVSKKKVTQKIMSARNEIPSEPFFLFVGDVDRDGPASKIKASGQKYYKKRLESKPENWETITALIESPKAEGVLVKLTRFSYELLARPEYEAAGDRLLAAIRKKPYILFVHQTMMEPSPSESLEAPAEEPNTDGPAWLESEDPYGENLWEDVFTPLDSQTKEQVELRLAAHGLELTPYETNAEMSMLGLLFLEQNESNLIFRIYIPAGRAWASETEKLLALFRQHLDQVIGIKIRYNQSATSKGVVHEFTAEEPFEPGRFANEFFEFKNVLSMAAYNPDGARRWLRTQRVGESEITSIIDRYAREARRLDVDLKQERERRVLSIRHRLEVELAEMISQEDWPDMYRLIDETVPNATREDRANALPALSIVGNVGPVNVNFQPRIIRAVNSVVTDEVSGEVALSAGGKELLGVIKDYGGDTADQLASSVHELEDEDLSANVRLAARQRLLGFLLRAVPTVKQIGSNLLQKYLEQKLGL